MEAPEPKRQRLENESNNHMEENNSNGESSSEPEDESYEVMNLTLVGQVPEKCDATGIICLLRSSYLGECVICKKLADFIIDHKDISSVIVQEEDDIASENGEQSKDGDQEVIFGVNSILSLSREQNDQLVDTICKYFISNLEKRRNHVPHDVYEKLMWVLGVQGKESFPQPKVGLIINERFVNLSAQVAIPALKNLLKDISSSEGNKFDYYLMVLKTLAPLHMMDATKEDTTENTIIYMKSEEELFFKHAKWSFTYRPTIESGINQSLHSDEDQMEDKETEVFCQMKVIVFESGMLETIVREIEKTLDTTLK